MLSSLCRYDHSSATSFCPLVGSTIDHSLVKILDIVKVLYGNVQTPFEQESHWWSVQDAKRMTVHHRRDLPPSSNKAPYPSVKRTDTSFQYTSNAHGHVSVPDPYNWLEQSIADSSDVKAFVDTQNAFAKAYFDQCKNADAYAQTIRSFTDQPYYSSPQSLGPKDNLTYFYWHGESPDAAPSYYLATPAELLAAEKSNWSAPPGKKFYDPAALSNGTSLSGDFTPSFNGLMTTYAVASDDADTLTVYFRNLNSPWVTAGPDAGGPNHLPDVLTNVTFYYGQWTFDDEGVFYHASVPGDKEGSGAKNVPVLMYHRLGTAQGLDIQVLALDAQDTDSSCAEVTTDDGKWLYVECLIDGDINSRGREYAAALDQPISAEMKWISIVSEFKDAFIQVTNVDDDFFYMTNRDAPYWKVVRARLDPKSATPAKRLSDLKGESIFVDLIPEKKGYLISVAQFVSNDKLLVRYIHDVYHYLFQFELKTGRMVSQLFRHHLGSVLEINARTHTDEVFVTLANLTAPNVIYRLAWQDSVGSALGLPTITIDRKKEVQGLDLKVLETRQVFITSTDGVKLPTLLMYRKGTPVDGTAPSWMLVRGGFRFTWSACFDPAISWWVQTFGGVFVVASVRGGLEYGEEWHLDGALKKKRNTFIDTIAIAQYLADQKIAAKGKISLIGGQVGGLTALAVANMAPEGLFGAIFAVGGLGDMLRYELFGAGPSWIGEFGDPSDPTFFDVLYGYSPLHNVNASKAYPFMLLAASAGDSETPPLHSFKVIAELQHKLPDSPLPLLMSTEDKATEDALRYCLIERTLGLKRLS